MTTEEIEKAASEYADFTKTACLVDGIELTSDDYVFAEADFRNGAEFADKHWQEKTRWKSLEKEPPSELQYDKMYLLRTESESPYLAPLPYEQSVKEYISYGFIEWKEID